jgi:nitrate/nitrite-specific signal transduction histidine kinase
MAVESREAKGRRPLDMHRLRWLAIVLPVVFLSSLDVLRHTALSGILHTVPGFIAVNSAMVVGVVVFSYSMFGLVGKLQRKVMDQNRQLQGLNSIAKAAAAKPSLTDLLSTSLDSILSTMRADAGLVCLVDLEEEVHSAVCHKGFSSELVARIQRTKLQDDPIAAQVVRTGQIVVLERLFDDPRVSEVAKREGVRSGLSAPLNFEGEVTGTLVVATREERHFTPADQEFLHGIGGQLGMAIRNATLYEEAQLRNLELGALLEVGKTVASSLDLDELLNRSLDTIIEVTSAEEAEMWLMGPEDHLTMGCHRGPNQEAFLGRTEFGLGEGIPGIVAEDLEAIVVHDLASDPRFLRQRVVNEGFNTFCALPLRHQAKLVGVLAVAARSADALKKPREIHLLEGIGERLAVAIENAQLYQQVQDLAVLQERERIAREMHDGMAQLLGYINTQTIAVRKFLSDGRVDEARGELTKMEETARDLYADVREGILGLRLASMRHEGLLPALREYTERYMEMSGIPVEIDVPLGAEGSKLPPSVEIQLMRVVQEALTNVRKHSKATSVQVKFEPNGDNELRVIIADDGQGFELARPRLTGWPRFGLQTMRERAEAVGGALKIDSAVGKGTRVEVRVPLPQASN